MILDTLNEFASNVSVAGAAGTALIGNVIDLTTARDIGGGSPLYLVLIATVDIITGGAAGTISFSLASDAQAAIATDGSATIHFATGDFVTDDAALNGLDAGATIAVIALPREGNAYERFLGVLATVATTTVTVGSIDAFLTADPKAWKAYAEAAN